jgi:hypothetical protein
MPYATEVEYRAALAAYRALHKVFYRFYASVRAQHPGAWADQLPAAPDVLAADERDYESLVRELVPSVARLYAGPRQYVDRLTDTLRELGAKHAASPQTAFDALEVHHAYIDVDNIFQDLLREREHYPDVFDAAFSEGENQPPR